MFQATEAVRALARHQKIGTARYRCPDCSDGRRNQHDDPLSVTLDETDHLTFLCHHCGLKGGCDLDPPELPPTYRPPTEANPNIGYDYLASRGITRATVDAAGVVYQVAHAFRQGIGRAIGFPYKIDGKEYATKWRGVDAKQFNQTGAAQTLWGVERLKIGDAIVITEGEIDALSMWQAGIPAVSVPNGAPQQVSASSPKGDDKKYLYLHGLDELLDKAPRFVIATDDDAQGQALSEELARRLGRSKCWKVRWPDGCKDANAVLTTEGVGALREAVEHAQPWPVKGLYDVLHFAEAVNRLYVEGVVHGQSTGFDEVDAIYTVLPGQVSIVTGIPSMGKSAFVDQVMVNIAQREGWRFALCSFENEPRIHIAKLMQLHMRKPFFEGPTPRLTEDEKVHGLRWVHDHFSFLFQGDGAQSDIDDIIDRLKTAVLRYGIKGAVIDPANFIDKNRDISETEWVSDVLTKLKVFVMAHDLHLWFVAHPAKQFRTDNGTYRVPGGYDISGSAHWFNKADVGLTVHRPNFEDHSADVHVWKCRYNWVGKQGKASLIYDPATGCYVQKSARWAPPPTWRGATSTLN